MAAIAPSHPELCALIADRIEQSPQQRLTFAEFMALALYHPHYGYYATHDTQIGPGGDFITSAHLGHDFGELLAEQFADMWRSLNRPTSFDLVEMGAGQGLVATDVLDYLQRHHPDCFQALRYTIAEESLSLTAAQQQRLRSWRDQGVAIAWRSLSDLAPESITGCFFSNELVDALPVHRVILTEAGLQELYVTQSNHPEHPFTSTAGPLSTEALATYFEQSGIALCPPHYPLGYTTEVNLAALDWLQQVAARLRRGYVLTIDYGYSADRYYRPSRSQGTLQCYTRHAHHDDPFVQIGRQDITAHVDFTALIREGQRSGLEQIGQIQQGPFLMALGLGDRLNQLAAIQETDANTLRQALRRRETLHQLINPLGLGNFEVLIQGKGVTAPQSRPLKGLNIPPRWRGERP